jgi:hypothetical protein
LGFNRGRLKSVYQVLRGKDPNTEVVSPVRREAQFDRLRESQPTVLDLTHWHQFFSALVGAGFRTRELISSDNAILYSYAIYLIGKTRYRVPERILQKLMGRWFYAVTLSGRYTGSPETVMDGDLNRLKDLGDADAFVDVLERIIQGTLTRDFWSITLPNQLDTSAARSPELFAYHASQNILGALVLFSHKRISDLLDPTVAARKRALERHHLFPRAWLERNGVSDLKQINQVGNLALLEWPENIDIGDDPPSEYLPKIRRRFDPATWTAMCRLHALPDGWETLSYQEFLAQRRRLMAEVIREGFERVEGGAVDYAPPTQPLAGVDEPSEETETDEDSSASAERRALRLRFWSELLTRARPKSSVHANRSATEAHWLAGGAGRRGFSLNYLIWPHRAGVELYVDRGKGSGSESKALFDQLLAERVAIETEFGAELDWQRLEGKRASRVRSEVETGGYRDLERWPEIQETMIDAMIRMERAVKPRIQELGKLCSYSHPHA